MCNAAEMVKKPSANKKTHTLEVIMTETGVKTGTIKSIQILRAVAALSVVYVHCTTAGDYKFPSAGAFGVDIFFVISGFIIAYMISRNTKNFLIKRIIRVWPLYLLATVAMTLTVILFPDLVHSTTVSVSGFIKSILFIPGPENRGQPVLGQGWTLNYEIFFYISMGLCLLFVKNKKYIAIVCAAALGLFIIVLNMINSNNYILNYYRRGLFPEFIGGILLYYIYSFLCDREYRKMKIINLALLTAAGVCGYGYMVFSEITGFQITGNRNINLGIPAFIMVTSIVFMEKEIPDNKLVKFIVLLGEASYAMYLFHYHIVTFFSRIVFPKIFGMDNENIPVGLIKLLLGICFTIIISIIIYEDIDKRIQKYLRTVIRKNKPKL
jgi:peptidoglycan/LPS O-acetylase OafA/YrhL